MRTTAEVHVEGTAGDPAVRSREWLDELNRELLTAARSKAALRTELHLAPAERQAATACCTGQVRPQPAVLDSVLHAQAAGATQTRLLVRALPIQHRVIDEYVHALTTTSAAENVVAAAHSVVTVLTTCVEIQHELLLPALAAPARGRRRPATWTPGRAGANWTSRPSSTCARSCAAAGNPASSGPTPGWPKANRAYW